MDWLGYREEPSEAAKDADAAAYQIVTAMADVVRLVDAVDWRMDGPSVTRDQYEVLCEEMADAAATFQERYDVACSHASQQEIERLVELREQIIRSAQNTFTGIITRYGDEGEIVRPYDAAYLEERYGIEPDNL